MLAYRDELAALAEGHRDAFLVWLGGRSGSLASSGGGRVGVEPEEFGGAGPWLSGRWRWRRGRLGWLGPVCALEGVEPGGFQGSQFVDGLGLSCFEGFLHEPVDGAPVGVAIRLATCW